MLCKCIVCAVHHRAARHMLYESLKGSTYSILQFRWHHRGQRPRLRGGQRREAALSPLACAKAHAAIHGAVPSRTAKFTHSVLSSWHNRSPSCPDRAPFATGAVASATGGRRTRPSKPPGEKQDFYARESWQQVGASEVMIEALKALGFTRPSHVQAEALMVIFSGATLCTGIKSLACCT